MLRRSILILFATIWTQAAIAEPRLSPSFAAQAVTAPISRSTDEVALPPEHSRLLDRSLRFDEAELTASPRRRLETLRKSVATLGRHSEHETAKELFEWLHEEVLTGPFDAYAQSVATTLVSGRYNCLTASILYVDFCRQLGIKANIAASPAHVRVAILVEGGRFWIELTRPHWRPSRTALPDEILINDTRALARLAYNRGTRLARDGQHASAVKWLRKSVRLDPQHVESTDNLVATFNNWAVQEIRVGNFRRARRLLENGLEYRQHARDLLQTLEYLNQLQG